MYEQNLQFYDELINQCNRFERKGKTMPYTSANGHMFTLFNKAGEIGIRFSKERQKEYFKKYNTSFFISYNAKMQGYILVTEEMRKNPENLKALFNESYDYVMSLEPK